MNLNNDIRPESQPFNESQPSREFQLWEESGQFLELAQSGHHVFYRQWGKHDTGADQTCLLLHGFPECSFSFHKVVDGLLDIFERVIVFDMLGYGLSDKPDGLKHPISTDGSVEICTKNKTGFSYSLLEQADVALQVWDKLGVNGGHIISHDMGTSVLTEIVARSIGQKGVDESNSSFFKHGIQSLTFTNGSMVLGLAKLRLMQRLLLSSVGPFISQFSSYSLFRKSVISAHGATEEHALNEYDIKHLWKHYCLKDGNKKGHYLIRYLNDRKRYETSRWLPALTKASETIPTHFCWGEADQVARVVMASHLSTQVCPDSQLTIMPKVGHFCQLGSPALWLSSVKQFYQSL